MLDGVVSSVLLHAATFDLQTATRWLSGSLNGATWDQVLPLAIAVLVVAPVLVLHDLNLAARYADHLVAVAGGRVHAAGAPADVLTEQVVREVFGLESRVVPDPVSGAPMVLPIGRHRIAAGWSRG